MTCLPSTVTFTGGAPGETCSTRTRAIPDWAWTGPAVSARAQSTARPARARFIAVVVVSISFEARSDLRITQLEDISRHYAPTLRAWRQRFDAASQQLIDLGYSRRLQRMWRFYLAYCEAGFREGRIGCIQALLARRALPP